MEDFILTDKVDEGVCKNLINIFECNSKFHFEGQVSGTGGEYDHVDISQKKSTDLELSNFTFPVIQEYYNLLQKILVGYLQSYPEVNTLPTFTATTARIQKYDKDGHFNSWHHERGSGNTQKRCLVYMTYLNDVEEGGETYFKYQNKKIKPEVGKTIIWPSDWTHTHKGVSPKSGFKYIATGWYVHTPEMQKHHH